MFNIFKKKRKGKITIKVIEEGDRIEVNLEVRNLKSEAAIKALEHSIEQLFKLNPTYLDRRIKELAKKLFGEADKTQDKELQDIFQKIDEMK